MKASIVINSYKNGQRNFSGEKLRGQNFAGQNLSEANFSNCDIRGANFKGATLTGANFTEATAGLQKRWIIGLMLVALLFTGLFSFVAPILGVLVAYIFDSSSLENQVIGWTSLLVLLIFCIFSYFRGLVGGAVAVALAVPVALAFTVALDGGLAAAVALGGGVAFTVVGAVVGAVAVAGGIAFTVAGAVAFTIAVGGAGVLALVGAAVGAFAVAGAVPLTLFSCYLAYRAMKGDPKDAWIKNFAVAFATTGGTTFKKANLTDANFTEARLKSTDFRDAILIRTCFKNTEKLDRIRPGKTYLSNTNLKQWLIGTGTNKNFDRQDLRGVHLQAANLTDASFIGADLSNANLQDADLSRAKLIQTQLDNTDLTGVTLTGATIEDWGITSHTNLRGVRCNYIFMKESTTADPNPRRKPDNWEEEFEDGDFAEFIQPLVNTLDLYHNQGIDPRAIAIAFKQLAEEHPDAELQIVAIEKRGNDKLLIRAATTPEANHSELNKEYFTNYNKLKSLNEQYRGKLEEKDNHIQRLENMISTALEKPDFYLEKPSFNYQHQEEYIMSENIDNSQNIKIRDINANQSIVNLRDISGRVSNKIEQLPEHLEDGKRSIKELLSQLQNAIETDENLKDIQKVEALEAVESLTEAANKPEDSNLKKYAKLSKNALIGITANLPNATRLVQECNQLLPEIAQLLGLS
ncbi:MAG: pentapeptide repeat-containing protein [Crocosphaera sp.]|nr:pentapeptide repeat-containing protein [Crocosphaera sp.]